MATLSMPTDVRLMNGVSAAVFVIAGLTLAAAGVLWLARAPWFPIRTIQLEGDLQRNSVTTIRANTTPRLTGNFFSFKLDMAREVFEAVPWVRHAVVRRVWPDRVAVRLEEHRPAALWQSEDGNQRLVNSFGEVFEANVGDVEDEGLPVLAGPEGTSAQMLTMLQTLAPLMQRIDREVEELHLSGRGSWRVELDGETRIELGRGGDAEVLARTERFVRTLAQVSGHFRAPLKYADLRHPDGYAVRMRGITTTPAASVPPNAPVRSN